MTGNRITCAMMGIHVLSPNAVRIGGYQSPAVSSSSSSAALYPEPGIGNDIVLDFEEKREAVTAGRVSHLNDYLRILNNPDIPRFLKWSITISVYN